jgi:uncharacterized protein GlcG (DUF336 family)
VAEFVPSAKLTLEGATKIIQAAIAKADELGVPECISVVDAGGHLLAFARMDGAFAMSIETSLVKARTAASYGVPTGGLPEGIDVKLAIATQGRRINLIGGLPIVMGEHVIGGIGVGSGTGEQDRAVAAEGLRALEALQQFQY